MVDSKFYAYDESLQYINGIDEYYSETISDVWDNCVVESVISIYNSLYKGILINICFGLLTSFGLPDILFHILSAASGIYLLYTTVQSTGGLVIIVIFFTFSYVLFFADITINQRLQEQNYGVLKYHKYFSVIEHGLVLILVLFEHILLDAEIWLAIRGIVMVFTMKIISLSADVKTGNVKVPAITQYFGYIFCGANILFGPWIRFQEYLHLVNYPTRKSIWWVIGIAKALFMSIFFLSISNCWASYFINDESNRFLVGYKEALSFRTSHYFVCYISISFTLSAGWKNSEDWFDDSQWKFSITDPLVIEFPTALAIVVVNWNKPMHKFLKKYIYRKWLPTGKFYAFLLTFVMSSLFHGFEIKISVVLISIGVFSYLQLTVREYLADTFNCCLKVYPCKKCNHKYTRDYILTRIAIFIFAIVTVLHLIYLGVLMDPSTDEIGIYNKWSNLYFVSFWIMFINFLIVK